MKTLFLGFICEHVYSIHDIHTMPYLDYVKIVYRSYKSLHTETKEQTIFFSRGFIRFTQLFKMPLCPNSYRMFMVEFWLLLNIDLYWSSKRHQDSAWILICQKSLRSQKNQYRHPTGIQQKKGLDMEFIRSCTLEYFHHIQLHICKFIDGPFLNSSKITY